MFDQALRPDVAAIDLALEQMVWRVVTRYGELAGSPAAVGSTYTYALFDGLFQQALVAHHSVPGSADTMLRDGVIATLTSLDRMSQPGQSTAPR
jgi:hypothetical protein